MFDPSDLDTLCQQLSDRAAALDREPTWPAEQLSLCARHGVFGWFVPVEYGGADWSESDVIRGYLRLSAACLTTTFIITQWSAACRRIVASENESLKRSLLPPLALGERFTTVGISHLTTSRRHLARPALQVETDGSDFVLDGFSPWVTGAAHADVLVLGAQAEDGRQTLFAVPRETPGLTVDPAAALVALTASETAMVRCDHVRVAAETVIAGPAENILSQVSGSRTGGLQTSTLAIGLARAACDFLQAEAAKREDLAETAGEFDREQRRLEAQLLALADGDPVCTNETLRARANSLALRSTQAALAAAKGAGYVLGHPAGRWCREAMFFLVWSCPQPVVAANLCELAGLAD